MKQVRQPRFGDPAGVLELVDVDPDPDSGRGANAAGMI